MIATENCLQVFRSLWTNELDRVRGFEPCSVVVAGLLCKFHAAKPETRTGLVAMFESIRPTMQWDYEHDVIVLDESPAPGLSLTDMAGGWEGSLQDGTIVCVSRPDPDLVVICIGGGVVAWMDLACGHTLCYIQEELTEGGVRQHPQADAYVLPLLHAVLGACDLYVLHAAAVASNDSALLLLGESGAGKTTLSLALARGGMSLLGDDLVVVQSTRDCVVVHPLLLKPKISDGVGDGKRAIDVVRQEQLETAGVSRIGALVRLPGTHGSTHEATSVQSFEALSWILSQGSPPALLRYPNKWIDTASDIASCVPGWLWSPPYPTPSLMRPIMHQALEILDTNGNQPIPDKTTPYL